MSQGTHSHVNEDPVSIPCEQRKHSYKIEAKNKVKNIIPGLFPVVKFGANQVPNWELERSGWDELELVPAQRYNTEQQEKAHVGLPTI